MQPVSNKEFLEVVFGKDALWVHVTSFPDDPSDIPNDRRRACWAGGFASQYHIQPSTNQYYTISTFYADEHQKARRKKALFRHTHVIVADDVREKLDIVSVEKLPKPTFKLASSKGSEQWGWVLDHPETVRSRVENLLDGLVAKGLAPDGKDPGMKGVTRYVRLPEGINSKASRLDAQGRAWQCVMLEWNPEIKVSIESLAEPFSVDLDVVRREGRVDGAASIPDHPLLHIDDLIHVKEVRSDGRFDITCPWTDSHTAQADDGAAIFTNDDGSIGFKCHHGGCQGRTGNDMIKFIEGHEPGFETRLKSWQFMHNMKRASGITDVTPLVPIAPAAPAPPQQIAPVDFMNSIKVESQPVQLVAVAPAVPEVSTDNFDQILNLISLELVMDKQVVMATEFLKMVDGMGYAIRLNHHKNVCDIMRWSKADLARVLDEGRVIWYEKTAEEFYGEIVYVAEQDQYYNVDKKLWHSISGFRNAYSHIDSEVQTEALINGKVEKVDRLDYLPGGPRIFTEFGIKYLNSFKGFDIQTRQGDASPWLDHFTALGFSDSERDHVLKFMAYTIRFPETKINHMIIIGGAEGIGKDFVLYPLIRAMGTEHTSIDGDELLSQFNDFIIGTKHLHINELEMGNYADASRITNKLKPYCTAPPDTLRVNPKGQKGMAIRNLVSCTACTNSALPLVVSRDTRRFFALWSDLKVKEGKNVKPEWVEYFSRLWGWMKQGDNWKTCVNYLLTEVDLTSFDPGITPETTGFLQDMQDASADPIGEAIRELIQQKFGLFQLDVLTVSDMHRALKQCLGMTEFAHMPTRLPSISTLGKILRQEGIGTMVRVQRDATEYRLWVIRHHGEFNLMEKPTILNIYQRDIAAMRDKGTLSIVKTEVPK